MNTPNPLIPHGSLLEQKSKGKPHLRIAAFIVAIHVVFIGVVLMQGCKGQDQTATQTAATNINETAEMELPPLDTSALYSNVPPIDTSPPPSAIVPPGVYGAPPGVTTPPALEITSPAPTTEYTVMKGDSFSKIAIERGASISAIQELNPGVDSTRLKIGQKLIVPPGSATSAGASGLFETAAAETEPTTTYVVKPGDNLTKIARAHGTTVKAIRAVNGLKSDRILVGQKLKLPVVERQPAAPPTNAAGTPLPPLAAPAPPLTTVQ